MASQCVNVTSVEAITEGEDIQDVGAPELIGPFHSQPTQKTGVGSVPLCRSADIGHLADQHQAHQPPDVLVVHTVALGSKVPRHRRDAVEWGFAELFVDHPHIRRAASPEPARNSKKTGLKRDTH
jgi:hypothetical protein